MASLSVVRQVLQAASNPSNLVRRGGAVASIAPGLLTVKGLSENVFLGELVTIGNAGLGEVVKIEGSSILVCPFDVDLPINLGDHVFADRLVQPGPLKIGWRAF